MAAQVIGASLHYIATFLLVGALLAQMYLLKLSPNRETLATLARADAMYGIGAALVLLTGLVRVFHGGKGLAYYLHNGSFHGAVTLFVVAALVSIAPTLRYRRWNRAVATSANLPTAAQWMGQRKWIHLQLGLISLIAVCMAMMARGVGSFS